MFTDEDDLRDVISAVMSLAGRGKDLGISLGLRAGDLDIILSNNPHSCSDRLREVLALWLRQSYNVRITLIYIIIHTTPSPNTTPCFFLQWVWQWSGQDELSQKLVLEFVGCLPSHNCTLLIPEYHLLLHGKTSLECDCVSSRNSMQQKMLGLYLLCLVDNLETVS